MAVVEAHWLLSAFAPHFSSSFLLENVCVCVGCVCNEK